MYDTLVSKICGSTADHWTVSIGPCNHATREDFRLNVTAFWLLPGRKITNYLEIISTSDWADPAPVARTKHWQVQSLPMHTAHTYKHLHTAKCTIHTCTMHNADTLTKCALHTLSPCTHCSSHSVPCLAACT